MNIRDQLLYYVRVLFLALEATTSMGWIITRPVMKITQLVDPVVEPY